MKRLYVTAIAMLSMGLAFAGNNMAGESNPTADVNNAKVYEFNYNMRRLAQTLGLTTEQMNSVEALNRIYRDDITAAAKASDSERKALLDKAVLKDLRNMSYILTPEQYKKYQTLVNLTIANRTIGE